MGGRKFGFIQCPDFDEQVFVLADQLRSYKPNQVVRFTAFIDQQGKVSGKALQSGLKPPGSSKSSGGGSKWGGGARKWMKGGNKWGGQKKRRRIQKKNTPGGVLGEMVGKI